jgi:hypothetical protein
MTMTMARGTLPLRLAVALGLLGMGAATVGSRFRTASIVRMNHRSAWSLGSLFSFASILSIGSAGSLLSIGSFASILSIGSSRSVLSIGSSGTFLRIGAGTGV